MREPMVSALLRACSGVHANVMVTVGRTLGIFRSGVIDMEEDFASGYGGGKWRQVLEDEGLAKLHSLLPRAD